MLAALANVRKGAGFALHCVHVEHGIRPPEESRGDASAVQALCEKLDVPCRVVSIAPGKIAAFAANGGPGIEGAARAFRRRALLRERRRTGADYILTAHTRDDLQETVLMRVLRGSGPAGLAAMPQVRAFMLRPLLELTRQDVLSYLEEKAIPHRTDSTNADTRFLRNRIRHKLIPLLDECFPSWRTSLMSLAETQSLTANFLAAETRRRLPWKGGKGRLRLDEADFLSAPPILREEAIFAGADTLARACGPVPKRAVVRRAAGAGAADLGPVRLRRQGGFIELTPALRSPGERGFSLVINEAGEYTFTIRASRNKDFALKKKLCVRSGLAAAGTSGSFPAAFPLVLRNYRSGDRICKGGHKRRFSDILSRNACIGREPRSLTTAVPSGYTGVITAEDTEGTAAFIVLKEGGELLVISREAAPSGVSSFFEVFGGSNV
ncbi:MAG: tRNA lysidine(34) synthetase TilS [Treponema sp.]|nr:tRNA lysidine(34) synthetase TilS [Treponema sp.]